ncbi:MAG: imidazole glycerol phosphate synthase subunit HisH [Pyrinomonadaceae bacterium]
MRVAIIKYNAGNTLSVANALTRLGVDAVVTDSPEQLRSAERVIFPGVGEASSAMVYLRQHSLDEVVRSLRQPVLGICLGMQLMCAYSEENDTECLGIFPYRVRGFESRTLKVPHTGWNRITGLCSPLFAGVAESEYMYFVHSFYLEGGGSATAVTDYSQKFSSAIEQNNFYAVQFHPERSGNAGARVLENFLKL